jgi:hypothetical protein
MKDGKKAQEAPKSTKRNYEYLKKEFTAGFFEKKWKSVLEFSKHKGVDYRNGSWKKNTRGWLDDAKAEKDIFDNALGSHVADKLLQAIGSDWIKVYKSLNKTAISLSEKLESAVSESDFIFKKTTGEGESAVIKKSIDAKGLRDCAGAGLDILMLVKKTTIASEIPLATDSLHKIQENKESREISKSDFPFSDLEKKLDRIESKIQRKK